MLRRKPADLNHVALDRRENDHVVAGERSMFRLMSLERSITKISTQYDREHARREQLEARVLKLRPGSIDPDLLEERARAVLGYARPDERIVILRN